MKPRKLDLEKIELKKGSHKSIKDGGCIMELVGYMAGEGWSDHPKCACPILTEYAIRLNDNFTDEHRQKLRDFIPLLINSVGSDELRIARKRLLRWRFVTATYPHILELFKLPELAENLRKFKNTLEGMAEAKTFLEKHREEIYKDADAYANAYANANADAYANAYTYADAHAYANAYANAHPYTYTYTYALREKIVATSLETLRMALELKDEKI